MTSTKKPKNGTSPSKQQVQKYVPDQPDTDKAGQEKDKPLTLGRTEKLLKKHRLDVTKDEPGKRVYRKPNERPRPDLPSDAEVNRIVKQFKFRANPEIIKEVDACAQAEGMTRNAWIIQAIEAALD